MGCCASLPSADDFFATAPPPSIAGERPRLIDGLPNTVTVNPSPVVMSSIGSTDNSDGGVGPPFTADICDVGGTQVLARLQLPPHRSFGIGATLFDSAGAPVASLRSAHSTRQHGSSSSSYHVLAKARRRRAANTCGPPSHARPSRLPPRSRSPAGSRSFGASSLMGQAPRHLGTPSAPCRIWRA